ncbi:MAG: hypothetical protein ACAI25_09580, partial [Planctomycetota bacterium]
ALGALDALRPETSVRVEAATKLLKDPERDVRKAAFLALRRFKADARRLHPPAAMALVDYVDSQGDTDGINFQDLTDALAEVAGADAVPVLVRLAKSGDDWGAHGLGRVGPGALPAAELLASLMAGEKNRILMREWAAEAFVKLGPLDAATADKVVPDLLVALRAQGDGVEAGRIRGRALEGLLACAALPATVEKTVSEMIPGLTGDERGPWRRDLVQLLAERFPKSAAPFKETLLEVKETPRGAALLAELDPETPGLVVWVMDRLKVDAERIDVEGKSKCTHNPTEMAWLLRAARAFKKAPPFQLATERALWANDAATRDAARKTLAEMR